MANGDADKKWEHYCIQSKRIENMDRKIDTISRHFQVDGIIGEMSGSIKKIVAVAEEAEKRNNEASNKKENGTLPIKWLIFAVLGLVAILATLLGIKMPF